MQKIKGILEFSLEKEPFFFRKHAEKFNTGSIAVPLSFALSFFQYYFSTTIFKYILNYC